jgi:four helix bundle protein
MEIEFAHEKLEVWQLAVELADYGLSLSEEISKRNKHYRILEQFEQAVTSVPQNIAEGKGRNSKKEYLHFLYISRGSLYESLTLITIFHKRSWITEEQKTIFRQKAYIVVNKLKGLINAIST